jgi:hypothetical protein
MTTPGISSNIPVQARQQASQQPPAQSDKPELSVAQQQKASLNVSILESAQVTIGAKDQAQSLLLNTAIDKINELLAPELGENSAQKALDSGLDITPEATAERIASLSTAFFSAFKEQNPEDDESAVLEKFMDTIGNGIDKGFDEARNILEGLKVLEGEIASNIDETYTLVQEKLSAFEAMISQLTTE